MLHTLTDTTALVMMNSKVALATTHVLLHLNYNHHTPTGDSLQLVIVIGGSVIITLVLSVVALIIALALACCQKRRLNEICRKLQPEGMKISSPVRQQSEKLRLYATAVDMYHEICILNRSNSTWNIHSV